MGIIRALQRFHLVWKAQKALRLGQLDWACDLLDKINAYSLSGSTEKAAHLPLSVAMEASCRLKQRARRHLVLGNLKEALSDIQRAIKFSGKRPSLVALNRRILKSMHKEKAFSQRNALEGNRFLLWLEGHGTYLLVFGPRLTLGRANSGSDLTFVGIFESDLGEVQRQGEFHTIRAFSSHLTVNGMKVKQKVLLQGDRISAGKTSFVFRTPSPLDYTALFLCEGSNPLPGRASGLLLVDSFLRIGNLPSCHLPAYEAEGTCIVYARMGKLFVKEEPLTKNHSTRGKVTVLQPGKRHCAAGLTFTVTCETKSEGI